jgi:hypothetical protein
VLAPFRLRSKATGYTRGHAGSTIRGHHGSVERRRGSPRRWRWTSGCVDARLRRAGD